VFNIGDIIYCGGCDPQVPLARRVSRNSVELIKFYNGKKVNMSVKFDGQYTITCNECGFGHIFVNIIESIGINEKISTLVS